MNNPLTFQQELHSMSLSDLWALIEIAHSQKKRQSWQDFQNAIFLEIKRRIDLLKNKFEDDKIH